MQLKKFCKSRNCPTTETLYFYAGAELTAAETSPVAKHLSVCEFCCSELQFLTAHPPLEEKISPPEIPYQLRQLAEVLLDGKNAGLGFLNKLFRENELAQYSKTHLFSSGS